tara:strand:+ start:1671 stop:2831 length:1161 start_codon:yes stop_codon:yes gene_type:complete
MKAYNELKLAKELMKFQSITPLDAGIMKFLSKKLTKIGFKCKILEFKSKNSKPVKNLYARLGKSSPNFCYAGHTDVVPPGNLNDWTVNPFKPAVKGNYLIGRGANDMKASIACFISAVSKFKKKFKGSISLLITGDEEGIAINGTKKVVEYLKRKKEKINFCLVGEPTSVKLLGDMMKNGRRGSITGHLSVNGVQGHVAYPNQANNPAPVIAKILNYISNMKIDKGSKNFPPSNLEIVSINIKNNADNVIPQQARATFNIRFSDKQSSTSLKKKLNNIFKKICKKYDCSYKVNYYIQGESFLTKNNKTTKMIQNVIQKITKIKPKISTTGGTSDARFIRKISPCVEFGLVGAKKKGGMHKVDESVPLTDLKKLSIIYQEILINYFK